MTPYYSQQWNYIETFKSWVSPSFLSWETDGLMHNHWQSWRSVGRKESFTYTLGLASDPTVWIGLSQILCILSLRAAGVASVPSETVGTMTRMRCQLRIGFKTYCLFVAEHTFVFALGVSTPFRIVPANRLLLTLGDELVMARASSTYISIVTLSDGTAHDDHDHRPILPWSR